MIITIAGLSGSGKNTVGEILAKRLKLRLVDPTFKTLAEERRMDLMEFHRKAEKEHNIDKEFDARLISDVEKGPCVVTTWLGPWMILNADLRVWVSASQHARAARLSGRDSMTQEQALAHLAERDASNRTRYLDVYRIDIYDHSDFDLVVNSEKFTPEKIADIIIEAAAAKVGHSVICERMGITQLRKWHVPIAQKKAGQAGAKKEKKAVKQKALPKKAMKKAMKAKPKSRSKAKGKKKKSKR